MEAIETVRTSNHGAGDDIGIGRFGAEPLPPGGAGVVDAVGGDGGAAVVDVLRVVLAITHHVTHLLWVVS